MKVDTEDNCPIGLDRKKDCQDCNFYKDGKCEFDEIMGRKYPSKTSFGHVDK